jgi:hypothetical protein
MRCLYEIMRTPFDQLTVAERGVIELEHAMYLVRRTANEVRLNWWMSPRDMTYHVGYFNGVRFAVGATMNYAGTAYREFCRIAERYATEVEFLSYAYLQREVQS